MVYLINNSLINSFERLNNNILCPILMKDHAKTRDFDATKVRDVEIKDKALEKL